MQFQRLIVHRAKKVVGLRIGAAVAAYIPKTCGRDAAEAGGVDAPQTAPVPIKKIGFVGEVHRVATAGSLPAGLTGSVPIRVSAALATIAEGVAVISCSGDNIVKAPELPVTRTPICNQYSGPVKIPPPKSSVAVKNPLDTTVAALVTALPTWLPPIFVLNSEKTRSNVPLAGAPLAAKRPW